MNKEELKEAERNQRELERDEEIRNSVSEENPLGGQIEPYDIFSEQEYLKMMEMNKEEQEKIVEIGIKRKELYTSLREVRDEPGISLKDVAGICRAIFWKEEMESLIKELKICMADQK